MHIFYISLCSDLVLSDTTSFWQNHKKLPFPWRPDLYNIVLRENSEDKIIQISIFGNEIDCCK